MKIIVRWKDYEHLCIVWSRQEGMVYVRKRVREYEIEVKRKKKERKKKKRKKFIIGAWREQREKHVGRWKFLFRTKQSGCHKDRNRSGMKAGRQGVSPHGISYAWCRIRGLIAPPHNVNIPRQLTTVQRTRTRVNETGHSVIYGNASVSSFSLFPPISVRPCSTGRGRHITGVIVHNESLQTGLFILSLPTETYLSKQRNIDDCTGRRWQTLKKYRDLGRMRTDKLWPGTWARSEYVLHISRCAQRQCVTSPRRFSTFPDKLPPRSAIMDRIDSGRMRYRRDLGQVSAGEIEPIHDFVSFFFKPWNEKKGTKGR